MTDTKALRDSAECMANLLDNLAGFEPQDIDMDAVELRFEDENGFDTGCDISIVDTAKHSADIIRALLDQLEAERQPADYNQQVIDQRNAECVRLINELAALRGTQEPVAWQYRYNSGVPMGLWKTVDEESQCNMHAEYERRPIFTHPAKPVVVLSFEQWCESRGDKPLGWLREAMQDAYNGALEAAGIVVKDGE